MREGGGRLRVRGPGLAALMGQGGGREWDGAPPTPTEGCWGDKGRARPCSGGRRAWAAEDAQAEQRRERVAGARPLRALRSRRVSGEEEGNGDPRGPQESLGNARCRRSWQGAEVSGRRSVRRGAVARAGWPARGVPGWGPSGPSAPRTRGRPSLPARSRPARGPAHGRAHGPSARGRASSKRGCLDGALKHSRPGWTQARMKGDQKHSPK